MTKTNLNLASVKLISLGAKGIKVQYDRGSSRGSYVFNDEYDVKFKNPLPVELRNKFRMLVEHVVLICKMHESDATKSSIYVHHIISNGGTNFQLRATVHTFDDKTFEIATPKITEDTEYEGFDNVISLINDIYDDVIEYIESDKLIDENQIIMDFIKNKKEVDFSVEELSSEDRVQKAREILEDQGAIVLDQDDYTVTDGPEKTEPVVEEEVKEIPEGSATTETITTEIKESSVEEEPVTVPSPPAWE